jgi:hypothetical protein
MELRIVLRGETRIIQQKFYAQKFLRNQAETQKELISGLILKVTETRWRDLEFKGREETFVGEDKSFKG